ncbi:GTP-binding protein Rit2 isoform X3 [Tyto alba]|uniref:GTP-binding protein Rit2 isoform X3 n=1 Tax=Tyto alba TaxID=56313 RepID=UPI0014035474|nr:GTP-binding protein Rit2 isoform X3 [Tyto alba]
MRPSPANRGTAANMELENEMISSSSNSSAGSREYKVVMLGAGGVGKSAMTMQFISHRFPDYHDPTIEDAYKTQVRIDDEPAYLDILDTAGQAEFTAMRDQYMRGGEGFIICYSITDRQSFQEAAEFKELIYRVRHTYDIPLVLVGNKIDLEEFRQDIHQHHRPLFGYSCHIQLITGILNWIYSFTEVVGKTMSLHLMMFFITKTMG